MKTRSTAALAVAASSVLLLAACSTTSGAGGMSGMAHSGSGTTTSAPASSSPHNAQDVAFAQGMAMHHQQAIEMADMVLGKQGVNDTVRALALDIKNAQQPEIDEMNAWLTVWGQATMSGPTSSMGHGMGSASGDMMTEADMTALRNAGGAKASSLFLTQMIVHHQGALDMAQAQVAKGTNPAAIALAKKIISDQTAQIRQMQDLLKQV